MNMLTPKALVACAVMGMTCGPVAAQTTAKTPASATAPKPKPKAPAKAAPPPPPLVLADADEDQQRAFSLAHVGEHLCEFSQSLKVLANPSHAGYADVHFGKQVVTTKPVLSSTGALRFEDVRGQFLLIQIAFKSMLLDVVNGQRVVDECQHDKHREAKAKAEAAPPEVGLGISAPGPK